MLESSNIEISKSALGNNIKFIRSIIDMRVKISSVVKGNAYGHGIEIFVPLAEGEGINHFSVFSADEAARVREVCSDSTDIMIMGNIDNEDLSWAIENNIEFFVFENSRLEAAIKAAKKLKKKAKIHIEVETGMNRTGYEIKELRKAIELMKNSSDYISLEGLCTHYAGAESIANYVRIQKQYKNFIRLKNALLKQKLKPKRCHTACSAATIAYPKTQMDMVRIGILQYGYWPSRETHIHYFNRYRVEKNGVDPLKRIITWRSKVMNTKTVKTGEFVGYGTTYLAQFDMKIATVPVGYGHGFGRSLSNVGRVLLNGHRVGVVGMVNMNLMIIDITGLKVKKGDEVILIGEQGDVEISVASFSELSDQVNYETLTRLPLNIPRKIVD